MRLLASSGWTSEKDLSLPCRLLSAVVWCVALLCAYVPSAPTYAAEIRSGHSGHWYDPNRSGEGWVLEVLDGQRAGLYWYTYDEQGRQRWMIALGSIEEDAGGEYLDFPSLLVTRGGRFGPGFDPAQVQREHVGSAQLRFDNCDRGEFAFEAFGQSMRIPVSRIAHVMGTTCESRNGVPWRETTEAAWQSGSWYDPAHSGEGYTLHWMNPTTPLLTWYSYDTEGQQYWMVAVGQLGESGRLKFPELQATRGARFGQAFQAADVERFAWGELSIELGCGSAQLDYSSILPGFGDGRLQLRQLTQLLGEVCSYRAPKLTDLYDIEYTPLPIVDQARGFIMRGLTDSGVVVLVPGGAGNVVRRYIMNEDRWEDLVGPYLEGPSVGDPKIFPETDTMAAGHHSWSAASGWQPFEVPPRYVQWSTTDASLDFSVRIGRGVTVAGGAPTADQIDTWIWDRGVGYSTLPRVGGRDAAFPVCLSDDGRTVGGFVLATPPGLTGRRGAVVWIDRADPISLRDSSSLELSVVTLCTPGGLIFGADQTVPQGAHPNARQAWWWKSPELNGYLGDMSDAVSSGPFVYQVMDAAGEGNLVVGFYLTRPPRASDGFLWTPITGMTAVSALLEELSLVQPWADSPNLSVYARAVNSSGSRVLLEVTYNQGQTLQTRGAILTFSPKSPRW